MIGEPCVHVDRSILLGHDEHRVGTIVTLAIYERCPNPDIQIFEGAPHMARKKKTQHIQRRQPTQERAQVTVSIILEAAVQILRTERRAGFNTNRIAERAGISIGTLYGYFPNKDAIFIALARQIIEEDARALARVLDAGHGTETLRHLLRTLFQRHSDDSYVRRTVMSIYISEGFGADHDAQVETIVKEFVSQPERWLGRKASSIDPASLFVASRAIIGIARSFTEQGDVSRFPLQVIEDEAISLVHRYLL